MLIYSLNKLHKISYTHVRSLEITHQLHYYLSNIKSLVTAIVPQTAENPMAPKELKTAILIH